MGYWDCPYCDSKGIRGDMAACPNCGRPRGAVKFYLKDHAEAQEHKADRPPDVEYVDEEKDKYVNRNPDWYCSFCETLNSDNAQTCASCGASRADSEANYFQIHEKKKQREAAQAQPAQTPPKKSRLPVILIAAVLVIAGLFFFLNSSTTRGSQVSGISWERVIEVEQNTLFHESGWTVPAGGEITGQHREIHHYEQVFDHYQPVEVQRSRRVIDHYETYYTYEDLGNGMFRQVEQQKPVYTTEYYTETEQQPVYRSEPRYQTMYEYDIWRWVSLRQARAAGEDHNAYWPDPGLEENQREGGRAEAYRVQLKDKDGNVSRYRLAEADWRQLNPGDTVYVTAKRSGADPCISDEKGNPLYQLIAE